MQQIQLKRSRLLLVVWPLLLGFTLVGAWRINLQNYAVLQQQPSRTGLWFNTLMVDAAFMVVLYVLFQLLIDFTTVFTDKGLLRYYKGKRQLLAWAEVTDLTLKGSDEVILKALGWKISLSRTIFAAPEVMVEEIKSHLSPQARIKTTTNSIPGCLWPLLWPVLFWLVSLVGNAAYPPAVPFAHDLMWGVSCASCGADTKPYHRIRPHRASYPKTPNRKSE